MVQRFFRASGLLLVAVFALAGCDSVDEGGFGTTADYSTVSGPDELNLECTGTYSISSGPSGTWAITSGTASITSQYAIGHFQYATVVGSGGDFIIEFTVNGQSTALGGKEVSANPMLACG